ncbi:O-antigen polysaccharide polymerase Wzy [Priestia aryabhattai]|uniref:O-antigen polysaccharide polymerase Wzy n=1 Tax=Priestia aryabhattai TaxID=412384 RepID=UPI001C8DF804|nr:O-antigen polysaccharide polymerase Wzy [Priestia aryabhattai]MBY0029984.1 O-antigen polysaccharide polymerase Wzy [Priestia aryabhattai]
MNLNKPNSQNINNLSYLKTISISILLSVVGYMCYFFTKALVNNENEQLIVVFSWLGIGLVIYVFTSWYNLTKSFFDAYTIFMIFFFLFTFGQCFMWAFGIHDENEIGAIQMFPNFGVPSSVDIINAQVITLLGILMFHCGALMCYKKQFTKRRISGKSVDTELLVDSERYNRITLKSIFLTSTIIGIIVIPYQLYTSYTDFQIAKSYGYIALYYSDYVSNDPTILGLLNRMFFPCLLGLLIGSKFNKRIQWFVYIIFSIYLILNLLSGDRGSWLYKIIILVWLSHRCYKPINFTKLIKYVVFSLIFLHIVYAIVAIRDSGLSDINLSIISEAFSLEKSPIVTAIFEMGGSMKPTIILQKGGWTEWPYANTYVLAVIGMITNKLIYILGIPFELVSTWFSQDYLGITWGAGFSIIAEALLNGGPFFAPIILLIMGYAITSFIYINHNDVYTKRPLRFLFVASTLHFFIPITRNELHIQMKNWFYGVVVLMGLIMLFRFCFFKKIIKTKH